jgi:hypothetical protein
LTRKYVRPFNFESEPNQLGFHILHHDIAGTRIKSIMQEEITFEVFYEDQSTGLGGTHPLEWETDVCNRCGDAPWCEDGGTGEDGGV